MRRFQPVAALLTLFAALLFAGCNNAPDAGNNGDGHHEEEHDGHDHGHGDHDHAAHGPHDGLLIELGDGDYHGELVHEDDAGRITVYLLDGQLKDAVPIDADEITLNLTIERQPRDVTLAAQPQDGDPEGKSSRFVLEDAELVEAFHEHEVRGKLNVVIDGTPYGGPVHHDPHEEGEPHSHHHD